MKPQNKIPWIVVVLAIAFLAFDCFSSAWKRLKRWFGITAFALLAVCVSAQNVQLAHTNQLALQWSYPTNGITPDLGFVLYSSGTLAVNPTNWPVLAVVSPSNQVSWSGLTYPLASGTNDVFTWPIAATNVAQYYTISASNVTGLGVQATTPAMVVPLESIGSFLMVDHP